MSFARTPHSRPVPMIVAFGPNHDSYFIGHGVKYYAQKLPPSLHAKLASGDLNPCHMSWMSIARDGLRWAADNTLNDKIWWDTAIGEHIQNAFLGIPPAPPSNYVSFPEESDGHYLKGIKPGAWSAELGDLYVTSVREAQRDIDGFDVGLRRIMFGVGGSHIFCFDNGFQAKLQGLHDHPDNALHKVLQEYASQGPGWTIGPGSALSLHDPHMFVLVFQNNTTGAEEIRWVAPQEMSDRITELIEAANSPEGQAAIAVENQKRLLVLQSKIGLTMQMSQALMQSGQGLVAAATQHPVQYHNRTYY